MYLGVSPHHSASIGRILNLRTGYVSPQCHVVYDEMFTTVRAELTDDAFDEGTWTDLIRLEGHELTLDHADTQGGVVPFHEFFDDFVDSDLESSESKGDDNEGSISTESISTATSATESMTTVSSGTSSNKGDSIRLKSSRTGRSGPGSRVLDVEEVPNWPSRA